jgi:hypothetical protein
MDISVSIRESTRFIGGESTCTVLESDRVISLPALPNDEVGIKESFGVKDSLGEISYPERAQIVNSLSDVSDLEAADVEGTSYAV